MNALVRLTWTDLGALSADRLQAANVVLETRSDSLGLYRACGVPDSTQIEVQAAGPSSRTGIVPAQLGPLGVARVNLELDESDDPNAGRLTGAVAGTVRDSAGGAIVDALVLVDGTDQQVRTDSSGRFRLEHVPSGTQSLEVRLVGLAPTRRAVTVRPGEAAPLALTLMRTTLFDAVTITASPGPVSRVLADVRRRHRAGFGHLLLREDIERKGSVLSLILGIQNVRTIAGNLVNKDVLWVALMRHFTDECVGRVCYNGREADYDEITMLTPDEIEAIEVFTRAAQASMFIRGRSLTGDDRCGRTQFSSQDA